MLSAILKGSVRTQKKTWQKDHCWGMLVESNHLHKEYPMNCPYCASTVTKERTKKTALGYRTFCCSVCKRTFNELTGTVFNYLEYPTDIVLLVVLWRLRYKLSLRDLAEMFLERGFEFTHEAVRDWEVRFAPLMADQLRARRRGQAGRSWYVDETYVNVKGTWCYLYRAIDRDGNLVDSMLSEKRDMEAVKRFFKQAADVVGHGPERVTTDGHDSYPRAIRQTLGSDVLHRTNRYLNNRLEQDHRGIKQRYYPMRGFGSVASASRFCRAFDEVRQFFRVRTTMKQKVSLAQQREVFSQRLEALSAMVLVA
jgi:putative transposase